MEAYQYQIRKVSGLFKLRSTKEQELAFLCAELGQQGWELASVTYDWLVVSYTLFFKRQVKTA